MGTESESTIYADYNNDGVVDETVNASALESVILVDSDKDSSGALIWATAPGSGSNGTNIAIACAWGQKANRSSAGDGRALDLGTVVLPFQTIRSSCTLTLLVD